MKAKNKKLKSILMLMILLLIVGSVSGLAYVATTAVGKGQSTQVEQVSDANNEESTENKTEATDEELPNEESKEETITSNEGEASTSTKKQGFFGNHKIKLGLDLQGGVNIVYEPNIEEDMSAEELETAMQAAQSLIQKRLDAKGYTEAEVSIEGTKRLRVDIPGVEDPQRAIDEIGAAGMLHFIDLETGEEIVTGKNVKSARAGQNTQTGEYLVSIEMDSEGTKLFSDYTSNNIGKTIVIMLDETILSMPTISAHITDGSGIISGNFTLEEAQELAKNINSGARPFYP